MSCWGFFFLIVSAEELVLGSLYLSFVGSKTILSYFVIIWELITGSCWQWEPSTWSIRRAPWQPCRAGAGSWIQSTELCFGGIWQQGALAKFGQWAAGWQGALSMLCCSQVVGRSGSSGNWRQHLGSGASLPWTQAGPFQPAMKKLCQSLL